MGNLYLSYKEGFPKDLTCPFLEQYDGTIITYKDLEEQSSQYANGFCDIGLKQGDRVSIQVNKSPEVIYIYLACLRSNLIFHPLNTAYKESELSFFLEDAQPSLFICEKQIYESISSLELLSKPENIYTLNSDENESIHQIKREGDHEVVACSKDDTAALLYSSGTTGQPKGIILSHENIESNALALKEAWNFNKEDSLLHALPIYHVHGLFVALGCVFLSGSKIIWIDTFDTDRVIEILPKCTVMMGVPTYYTRLISNPNLNKEIVGNIRVFVSGSAPLLEDTFNQFHSKTGHFILERYGMTETNIICSNPIKGKRKAGTVGLPLKDQKLKIVDDNFNNLDEGEIGNIQVSGPNVFKMYWNLPDKTREDFSNDNFFNTGDKGFIDEDGYLTIVGRSKDMIISGGLNVYPKEIESIIDDLEGVDESAVIGVKDDDLGEKVVTFIVKKAGSEITKDALLSYLKKDIAGFKVPKDIIFIEELPRNAMGKVQKNILRENYQ